MTIVDKIKRMIPFLRGPMRLPGEVARSLRPVRSPLVKWRSEGGDGFTVIYSQRPKDKFWITWLARMAMEPEERRTELDEIGSRIWDLCNGANRVGEICKTIGLEYNLTDRQVEVSVLQFLNMLRQRKFIGLTEEDKRKVDIAIGKAKPGPDESADNHGKRTTGARKRARSQRRH